MKNIIIKISYLCILSLLLLSCDKYLDKIPDQRTEINTINKAMELLVSAYPNVDPMAIYEHRTDNVMDNGIQFGQANLMLEQNYYWQDITDTDWDAPEALWNSCYKAIATANKVLNSLETLPKDKYYNGVKAEALLCRAYAHFLLANTFCKPIMQSKDGSDLGIPYVKELETHIGKKYNRTTIKEVYQNLEKDITDALPLLNDGYLSVPLYHFNKRAATAFATRFFLYYGKWDKAIEYANQTIPQNPSAVLRNLSDYQKLAGANEWRDQFISKEEPANIMLVALRSLWGRNYTSARYGNSLSKTSKETYRSAGPWGGNLKDFDLLFGGSSYPVKFQPKYQEIFEITNITARNGIPHTVQMAFTTDETLLCRAEAKIMLKQYDEAAQDLSYWYVKKGGKEANVDKIVEFYTQRKDYDNDPQNEVPNYLKLVKPLHCPIDIDPQIQEPMLQAVLHARRIETIFSGLRYLDIVRYGIEVYHNINDNRPDTEPIVLKVDDPRRTIQIPNAVIAAGLTANPR